MDEKNKFGSKIEAELWRDGKLMPDEKQHKILIVRKDEVVEIKLKRSKQ